jgi:hypothetical protein
MRTSATLAVGVLLAGLCLADTTCDPGPMSTNTVWDAAHSPYVVLGDVSRGERIAHHPTRRGRGARQPTERVVVPN